MNVAGKFKVRPIAGHEPTWNHGFIDQEDSNLFYKIRTNLNVMF